MFHLVIFNYNNLFVPTAYVCHGHWTEGSSVYVVASPRGHPSQRLCLTASRTTNHHVNHHAFDNMSDSTNFNEYNNTMVVTAHAHSCPRRLVPKTTTLSVNLTTHSKFKVY